MMPFAIVVVDDSFIFELEIMALVLTLLGFMVGLVLFKKRLGPAGGVAWSSKRKRTPILLHEGKDGILRFWNSSRSFAGNWRAGRMREMTILPESKSVFSITKGSPMGMASANGVATLSPKYLWMADRISENMGRDLPERAKMGPDQISEYIGALRFRESEVRNILATINKVKNNEISMEDAVLEMMSQRGADPSNEEVKAKLTAALKGAFESQGAAYLNELQNIAREKTVSFKEGGWKIEWEERKTRPKGLHLFGKPIVKRFVKYIYAAIPVTLLNYISYMPGATIDDLQAALLEGEQAALLERTENRGQTFRWMTFGIVVFIIMIGMYVLLQQLGLVGGFVGK